MNHLPMFFYQTGRHLCASLLLLPFLAYGAADDAAHGEEASHQQGAVALSDSQRQLAGIVVQAVSERSFSLKAFANGTLQVDRQQTRILAPQLEVSVLARHVNPGQWVAKDTPLLTLGGAAVATAQADYVSAAAEWQRISRMNENAVSASRRLEVQLAYALKRAILESLQMSAAQIKALENQPAGVGSFQLLAPIAGRVQQNNSRLGELFAAGSTLLQLTDESYLWVAADVTPEQASHADSGNTILVRVGQQTAEAVVLGRSHELSSITRTEQLLARLDNRQLNWHAGQFAEIYLSQSENSGVLLPDSALYRSSDGDWQVFVEDADGFEPVEVQVLGSERGLNLVQGLTAGSRVAVSGAFFLGSELAKAGFDVHNH